MFISGVSKNDCRNVNFGSTARVVYANGKLTYKNTTCFFRPDIDWNSFAELLSDKYKRVLHVNVVNCACSDGTEAWSLAAILRNYAKKDADKFFPISASDKDSHIINTAKSLKCDIKDEELYAINSVLKEHYSKYFIPELSNDKNYSMALKPNAEMINSVKFEQADIFEILNKLPKKNNVILCRNFWAYLESGKRELLAKKLSEKLDDTSLVVIGSLEKGWKCDKLLKDNGFVETKVENVFTKPSSENDAITVKPDFYNLYRQKLYTYEYPSRVAEKEQYL